MTERSPTGNVRAMPETRSRVVIAGGGVGGLEAALCLQALAADRVEVTLLAPGPEFVYRALAVGEPFGLGAALRCKHEAIARDAGFRVVSDTLAGVELGARHAITGHGQALRYDHLVMALGTHRGIAVPGALTFRGPEDAGRTALTLATLATSGPAHVIFAAPEGVRWTLPLYELALLTAHWARTAATALRISLVTPEPAPLALFGDAGSAELSTLLDDAEIDVRCGRAPGSFVRGRLEVAGGGGLPATAVVALSRPLALPVPGLPDGPDGFVDVDELGRVPGEDGVYAVGDMTSRTIKQGGLAAQQAEVAAHAIAAAEGAVPAPKPYRPVLRGLLLTGDVPRYLRNDDERGPEVATGEPPWWPPHKIASRYLGPYLAAAHGVPT
jgi:sulfide:quinone oxidoreductase